MKTWFTLLISVVLTTSTWAQNCWNSIVPPNYNFIGDTLWICPNDDFSAMLINASPYDSVLWSTGSTSLNTTISDSGTYWVRVQVDTCVIIDTFQVETYPENNPYIVANGPTEFCTGDSVQLCVEPGPWSSILWNDGENTSCIIALSNFQYCATTIDANGCVGDTCFMVIVYPNPEPNIWANSTYDTLFTEMGYEGYQWYFNGQPIPNATNHFLIVPLSGNYDVEVVDNNGCVGSSLIEFSIPDHWPGIEEQSTIKSICLYPNPTKGEANLELQLKKPSEVQLWVKDMLGQEVLSRSYSSQTSFKTLIELEHLNNGVYLFYLNVGNETIVKKLVKE